MASKGRTWCWLLPESAKRLPADLSAVLALAALTFLAVFVPVLNETPLRIVFGLPFVLFVPGYALIAALFPEDGSRPAETADDSEESPEDGVLPDAESPVTRARERGIDGIERVALSFGLSIAVVPLTGLVLNFTPFGIRLVPIMVTVCGFTIVCTWVATRRRAELPANEQFSVPYRRWYATSRAELFEPDSRVDTALNVVLVCSVLLGVSSVGYAIAVPSQGDSFTEFYLLTEDETGGVVADDYPTEFQPGQTRPVVVGIGNHEHETVNYTIIAQLQRVSIEKVDNETVVTVRERSELGRFKASVPDNGTYQDTFEITPQTSGTDLRVVFLLYRGDPPATPTVENSYRETHLWVNVTAPG